MVLNPPLCVICFMTDSYNFNEGRDTSKQRAFITCTAYHKVTHILITGFDDGSFTIHEMPDFSLLNSYKLVLFKRFSSIFAFISILILNFAKELAV
jgi:hypothetical protein